MTREISLQEYHRIDTALKHAQEKLAAFHSKHNRSWVRHSAYFYSGCPIPCCYQGSVDSLPCLLTGEHLPKKEMPARFRESAPRGTRIRHFTAKGCPHVDMHTKVLCLVRVENSDTHYYFFGSHLVGQCPHKD